MMKKNILFVGSILSVIGLLMIFIPDQCIKAVVIILGIEAAANGIYNIIRTRKIVEDPDFNKVLFIRGVMSIIVGCAAFFLPLLIAKVMWTIMLYILAVYMIAAAFLSLYASAIIRNYGIDRKPFTLEAVISTIAAIVLFMLPARTVVQIGGAAVLVSGILCIFYFWKNKPVSIHQAEIFDENLGTLEKSDGSSI